MITNQTGDPVIEERLGPWGGTPSTEDIWQVVCLLLDHMKLEAYRTNATKHGYTEIELREQTK